MLQYKLVSSIKQMVTAWKVQNFECFVCLMYSVCFQHETVSLSCRHAMYGARFCTWVVMVLSHRNVTNSLIVATGWNRDFCHMLYVLYLVSNVDIARGIFIYMYE
jgi:hypothetical protein